MPLRQQTITARGPFWGFSSAGSRVLLLDGGTGSKSAAPNLVAIFGYEIVARNLECAPLWNANHSSGGNTWLINTSCMNSVQYNMLASPPDDSAATITLTGALVHKLRNNIGFANKNTNMAGVDSMFNTWDLASTETSSDFVSTMDTGFAGPRQADGSLPVLGFLKLAAHSLLIDRGTACHYCHPPKPCRPARRAAKAAVPRRVARPARA
jgi:hypothetical protein